MLSTRLTSDKSAPRPWSAMSVIPILPWDVDLPLHAVVVDRSTPVVLHDEIAAGPRDVDAAGAIAAHVDRPCDVVDLDLTRAILVDVHRPLHAPNVDPAGCIADPDVAAGVAHANVAGAVVDSDF